MMPLHMIARLVVFLSEAALHPGVLHMLRDLHDGTWFRLDGGYLIETSLGSR